VLVSAFGYQGYRNAKFGRIECHEAVNAVARDVLLTAKERLEAGGWRVLHGVVDGLWVTPRADVDAADREPLDAVVAAVSGATDVRLEREARYDWVCFVPRRGERAGALTRYFGRVADADGGGFKLRGIEARRRSTPAFVAAVQRDLLRTLDATRDPAAVVDRLDRHRRRLDAGAVDPAALVVDLRPSNAREEYDRDTLAAAALDRAADRGREHVPGRTVRFVVVDAEARGRARVRLPHEVTAGDDAGDDGTGARDGRPPYDPAYYGDALVRACESVVSPLGWDRARVERRLSDGRDASLGAY
jgi:DNA polymerase I